MNPAVSARRKKPDKAKKYKSEALAAIHGSATALYRVGGIDNKTMREFDATCLAPAVKTAAKATSK